MKHIFIFAFLLCITTAIHGQNLPPITLKLTKVATGFTAPVAMDAPNDGTGRLFIVDQLGQIRIVAGGKLLPKPFLDLKPKLDKINSGYSEKGLLGLAFHPQYKSNGIFYVYYSATTQMSGFNHISIVAEYKVSADANVADATSEKIILTIGEPESNHNGGTLMFGPDGYLYIGSGDGGGAGDRHGTIGNGQNQNTLLGKILRIDVNQKAEGKNYAIPTDNPFINQAGKRPEIFAWGLRNPWKFSFDKATRRLFVGDVGQDKYEEIDIVEKGKNYGWRIQEGYHCYDPDKNCNTSGLTAPIHEYDHGLGNSVTGGYVYRGSAIPAIVGKYVFADWSGKLFYLQEINGKWQRGNINIAGKNNNRPDAYVNSLGEDTNGALYFLLNENQGPNGSTGSVWRLEP